MSRLARCLGLVLALLPVACGADEPIAEEEESGEPPPGPPQLLGAEGESLPEILVVPANQTADLSFGVADLLSSTQVEFDGEASLPGGGAPAWLDAEAELLHVPLGGALVEGRHALALVHQVGSEPLRSEMLVLDVEASSPGTLSASLFGDPKGTGDRLVGAGQGAAVPLGLIEGQTLTAWAGAWGGPSVELDLPELGVGEEPGAPATWAGVELGIAASTQTRHLVVAWLDASRERAFARAVEVTGPGELIGEPGPVVELWSLEDPEDVERLGPHEYATLRAVALVERSVIVAVEARRDLEAQSPGDRLLVTRYLAGLDDALDPVLVRGSGGADLDLIGDARRSAGLDPGPRLGLRVDQAFAHELSIAHNGLPRVEEQDFAAVGTIPSEALWMRSIDGAFGSRHVFALALDPAQVFVMRALQSFVVEESEEAEGDEPMIGGTEMVELPAPPSGAPSLATIEGVPVLLVPQGADDEVLALRSTGAEILVDAVPELRCDALRLSPASADGVADTLPLACLRNGSLETGALGVD